MAIHRVLLAQAHLPSVYNPDEPWNVFAGQTMVHDRTLVPTAFTYPSFIYEYSALGDLVSRHLPGLDPVRFRPQTLGSGSVGGPVTYLLLRLGMIALSLVGLWLAVRVARRVDDRWLVAVIVAVGMGVSSLMIDNSFLITPDGPGTVFVLLALLGAARVLLSGGRGYAPWSAVLAGVGTGLATGTKYQLALVGIAVAAALLLRYGRLAHRQIETWIFLGTAAATFLATTPTVLLEPDKVREGMQYINVSYRAGRTDQVGATWWFHLKVLVGALGPLLPAAVFALRPLRRHEPMSRSDQLRWVLAGFSILYFAVASYPRVHFARNLAPVIPPLLILGAIGIADVVERARALRRPAATSVRAGLIALLAFPVFVSAVHTVRIVGDPRAEARHWIQRNVPVGSTIAIEDFAPVIDKSRWKIKWIKVGGQELEPLKSEVGYIVLTDESSGVIRRHPDRLAPGSIGYERLLAGFCLRFSSDHLGYGAEIYQRC